MIIEGADEILTPNSGDEPEVFNQELEGVYGQASRGRGAGAARRARWNLYVRTWRNQGDVYSELPNSERLSGNEVRSGGQKDRYGIRNNIYQANKQLLEQGDI